MTNVKDITTYFFDACETGKGWDVCRQYCHDDAGFTAQADTLKDITTLQAYTEWMKSMFTPMPNGHYEIRSFGIDPVSNSAIIYGIFRGTNTKVGGPVAPTGKSLEADYVYVMKFEGDKIRHMTKIWNDGHKSSANWLGLERKTHICEGLQELVKKLNRVCRDAVIVSSARNSSAPRPSNGTPGVWA